MHALIAHDLAAPRMFLVGFRRFAGVGLMVSRAHRGAVPRGSDRLPMVGLGLALSRSAGRRGMNLGPCVSSHVAGSIFDACDARSADVSPQRDEFCVDAVFAHAIADGFNDRCDAVCAGE